jgi:hypothetical protein
MALLETGRTEMGDDRRMAPQVGAGRRAMGLMVLSTCVLASAGWLGWRATHLSAHPIALMIFAAEVASVVAGLLVAIGLARTDLPGTRFDIDRREPFRFAFAVEDALDRPHTSNLRADLVGSYRTVRHGRPRLPDLTMAAVLTDGPRRLLLVVSLAVALLLGVAPMPVPPVWAIVFGLTGFIALSGSHVLLSGGRIRVGDRIRWSSAALGEVCAGADPDGVAPRRWVGTVAAVVSLNLAIALRGMSDRWTHGLAPMSTAGRQTAMLLAIITVVGGLYTLRTTTAPELTNAHLVSRRTEERTARQSAVGAAVIVGLIGLLAGVLPGNVDATDIDPVRIEQISHREAGRVEASETVGGVDG